MSFDTAVSGIKAASVSLGIIGNNIANSQTTGFKNARGDFADVFAFSLSGAGAVVGQGVQLADVNQSFTQGNISFTTNALDFAISGSGFFVLDDDGSPVYTRAGNFHVDRDGVVVNSKGNKLTVFETTNEGTVTGQTTNLRLQTDLIQPQATEEVVLTANLDSRMVPPTEVWGGPFDAFASPPTEPDPTMYNSSTALTVFDSLGNPHSMDVYFLKTATANEWEVYTLVDGVSVTGPDTMTFDTSGNIPLAAQPFTIDIVGWTPLDANGNANGAASQDFTFDLTETTQFGNEFGVSRVSQDGFTTGQLRSIDVDDKGLVFARFTNGQARVLGQIALAGFPNLNGLQELGNSAWGETFASGQATLSAPGTAGLGNIVSGAVEDSNVELTEQLVSMIVSQRNFQANAQVIEAEDLLTQTIIQMR